MKDFKSSITGNRIVINCASMKEVQKLKQVILTELKNSPFSFKLNGKTDDIMEKDVDLSGIIEFMKNSLIGIDTSEDFQVALYDCLKHCTYKNTYKINEDLFDNEDVPEAREDYYEIVFACVEENLRPFMKSLSSVWKTHIATGKIAQILKSA